VFTAPGVLNPYRLGQVIAGAIATLVNRDGLRPQELELRRSVIAGSKERQMDPLEEAAMNAAFQQYAAEIHDRVTLRA
jgi:hypothetical protein